MRHRRIIVRRRRQVAAILAATLVAAMVMAGVASATSSSAKTYTGCLTTGGTITLVKEGLSPQRACPAGSQQIRFGEGDITSITAGTGLAGGGANGDVTLQVAASYRLPQGCAADQIAVWDGSGWACGDDQAGDQLPDCGLGEAVTWIKTDTSLGEWGCQQFASADQACSAGKVVTGVDAFGEITCAASGSSGSGGLHGYSASGSSDLAGTETIASVDAPAGTYLLIGSVDASGHDLNDTSTISCTLGDDSLLLFLDEAGEPASEEVAPLVSSYDHPGGAIELQCTEVEANVSVFARFHAIPVSALN